MSRLNGHDILQHTTNAQSSKVEGGGTVVAVWSTYALLGHMWFTCLEHMSLFYVIGLSFDKKHFTCIWVDLGYV